MYKKVVLVGFLLVILSPLVSSQLALEDIRVFIDGTRSEVDTGGMIRDTAQPGDTLLINLTFANEYPKGNTSDIRRIRADLVIPNYGNTPDTDDDYEESSEDFTLIAQDKYAVTFILRLDPSLDARTYDLVFKTRGTSETGEDINLEKILHLEVRRKAHDLLIINSALEQDTISCTGQAVVVASLLNKGSQTEKRSVLLAEEKTQQYTSYEFFDLGNGKELENNTRTARFTLPIFPPGKYTIALKSFFDGSTADANLLDAKFLLLTVLPCEEQVEQVEPDEPEAPNPPADEETLGIEGPTSGGLATEEPTLIEPELSPSGAEGAKTGSWPASTIVILFVISLIIIILLCIVVLLMKFVR
ncbi:TPA: hypothetical protein HA369_03570 [Candidatus Woesearchaeota archaeon]|nr:hypothetical protein [Candidatus Woesearchaeota archaeon]HIJ03370.1 hypothetical protein [Candidatus Woesearchaeota archaeon]